MRVTAAVVVAVLLLSTTSVRAGPCSNAIAQFEQTVRQFANNPNAGPTARQETRCTRQSCRLHKSAHRSQANVQPAMTGAAPVKPLSLRWRKECAKDWQRLQSWQP